MLILCVCLSSWFFQHQISIHTTPAADFIVELSEGQYPLFIHEIETQGLRYTIERIHTHADYYRFSTLSPTQIEADLKRMYGLGLVRRWQYDRVVTKRNTPNDPLYPNQWDMTRIGMQEAWNQSIGGVTADGDTIVVAILDTGFDVDHEDLIHNVWINKAEIPGDGIDNDQNGYIDDYRGMNVRTDDGNHPEDIHGTGVAGIIGARGGNAIGICGVNWQVKMLFISGIQNESDIIEGYIYSRTLREKYESSGGEEGAFIVATSLSAGIDNALPEDHQLWCDQYEALGEAGILSICATTNANTDVDTDGDMPTTCASNYMIAVTNSDMNDTKLTFAGYGAQHIDLAAPGTTSLTTSIADDYEDFEGTSAAAPHVTGAVALLYAAACSEVLGGSDPDLLALQMRSLILENVDPVSSLAPITVSGGRLDVAQAIGSLVEICGSSGGELEIVQIVPNPVFEEAIVEYNIPDLNPYLLSLFDSSGKLILEERQTPAIPGIQFYSLSSVNLPPGVYHFSVNHKDKVVSKSLLVQ